MIERFFQPERLEDLSRALAELERRSAGDMVDIWGDEAGRSRAQWSTLRLPQSVMHPAAPRLWAGAAGVSAEAIAALQRSDAFVGDDGALTLWPWYREQEAVMRPLAEAEKERSGLALPRDFLDEPYDPRHYLERSGMTALHTLLASHGVDAGAGFVDRVPVPPRRSFKRATYEGGLSAEAVVEQRFLQLELCGSAAADIDTEECPELVENLVAAFARVISAMGGDSLPRTAAPRPVEAPPPLESIPPAGQVLSVWAVDGGALLGTEGRIVRLGEDGSFSWAIVARARIDFATGHGVEAGGYLLDLRSRGWRAGERGTLTAELGLPDVEGVGWLGRPMPVRSACGRYLLRFEQECIQRLEDTVDVASGKALDRLLRSSKRGRALLRPKDLEVGTSVTLDRGRSTLRGERPCAVDTGSAAALALRRDGAEEQGRWRVLLEGTVLENGLALARLGVAPVSAAFNADGSRLWALFPDHLARIDLDEAAPRLATLVPLAPILAAAEAV